MSEHRDIQGSFLTATTAALTAPDLVEWFLERGLCRVAIEADPDGEVNEVTAPPVLLLGRGAGDARACPHPDGLGYPDKRLAEMSLDDYHLFILRWLMRAVDAGLCSCFVCRKPILNDDPAAPWDGIFIEKELVAWLLMHFDCKRYLSREYKGYHPFDLIARPAEHFDVSHD
jgi:hypothetical protein